MKHTQYRPWGMLKWLLSKLPDKSWSFLGCLGTEERCLSAWRHLKINQTISYTKFLQVNDKPSRYKELLRNRLQTRRSVLLDEGGNNDSIKEVDLFCTHNEIISEVDIFLEEAESIVLDISSLPKRFFFPALRRILSKANELNIQNIVVTYTVPSSYQKDEPLAENFSDEWTHLPLFSGTDLETPCESLVVGVGFQALGLHTHLKGITGQSIKLLVPFPAPPASFMRSWDLLRQIEQSGSPGLFSRYRADAKDPSDTFDRLMSLSESGKKLIALAPFGPKPMSLGMCLFACLSNCEVFYTQPSVYHPDYSIGESLINGEPEIYAYAIRLSGKNLYQI